MVGVVIVTHGKMATELIKTADFIVGRVEAIKGLCIDPQASSEEIRRDIEEAIKSVDCGDGVLILTDMFGGTPSNISLAFLETGKVEVLSGVNLPMLLKLASPNRKSQPLEKLAESLLAAGHNSINLASKILNHDVS